MHVGGPVVGNERVHEAIKVLIGLQGSLSGHLFHYLASPLGILTTFTPIHVTEDLILFLHRGIWCLQAPKLQRQLFELKLPFIPCLR